MARALAAAAAVIGALALAGCSSDENATPVTDAACEDVYYEGEGEPDLIVVSDLPRRGPRRRAQTTPMVKAIELAMRERGFRAGDHRVGYQSCDDAIGEDWDESTCAANAEAYVANEDVAGVIGTYNSGCAVAMLPILSRRDAGPLAIVSPANTYAGLTRTGQGVDPEHPAGLYPDGIRNFARVAAPDDVQGAAGAVIAHERGAQRAVVLVQRAEDYAVANAASFAGAAREQGMDVTTFGYAARPDFEGFARRVADERPDAVYIAGLANANGRGLVEDLRAALGPDVLLIAPDAFIDLGAEFGKVGKGMLVTIVGSPPGPPATGFAGKLGIPPDELGGSWVLESGQAAYVLLDAIARSDGTRASITQELLATRVQDGLLGDFRIDQTGDIDPAAFSVYRFTGSGQEFAGTVAVPGELSR